MNFSAVLSPIGLAVTLLCISNQSSMASPSSTADPDETSAKADALLRGDCRKKMDHFFTLLTAYAGKEIPNVYPIGGVESKTFPWSAKYNETWDYFYRDILPLMEEHEGLSFEIWRENLGKYNKAKKRKNAENTGWILRTSSPFYMCNVMGDPKERILPACFPWFISHGFTRRSIELLESGVCDASDRLGILNLATSYGNFREKLPEGVYLREIVLPLLNDDTLLAEEIRIHSRSKLPPTHPFFRVPWGKLTIAHDAASSVAKQFGKREVLGTEDAVVIDREAHGNGVFIPDDPTGRMRPADWVPKLNLGVALAKKFVLARLAKADARDSLANLLMAPQTKLDEVQSEATLSAWWNLRPGNALSASAGIRDIQTLGKAYLRHAALRTQGIDVGPMQAKIAGKWQALWLADEIPLALPTAKESKEDALKWLLGTLDAYSKKPMPPKAAPMDGIEKMGLIADSEAVFRREWKELTAAPKPQKQTH